MTAQRVATTSLTLRALRLAREMSLRQLEGETGINRGVLSRIERGLVLPAPAQLAALAEALGVEHASWRIRFVLETEGESG